MVVGEAAAATDKATSLRPKPQQRVGWCRKEKKPAGRSFDGSNAISAQTKKAE